MLNRFHQFLKSEDSKFYYWHIFFLIVFTVLMVVISNKFKINELYDHPQFSNWTEFDAFISAVAAKGKQGWFYAFFATDAIWAILLLTFVYRYVWRFKHKADTKQYKECLEKEKGEKTSEESTNRIGNWFMPILLICFISAYIFDLFEGINYVFIQESKLLYTVVKIKTSLYFAGIVLTIYGVFQYWSRRSLFREGIDSHETSCNCKKPGTLKLYIEKSLRVFLRTSYLSIILVLILVLLAGLPQGYTMVVDLLDKPISLALTFVLLFLLAVVVSHYPAYFEAYRFLKTKDNLSFKFWPNPNYKFGVIYYNLDNTDEDEIDQKENSCEAKYRWIHGFQSNGFSKYSKILRYHLGTVMFISFLYLLGYAADSIYEGFWFKQQYAFLLLLLAILFQDWLRKNDDKKDTLSKSWFRTSGILAILFIVITVCISAMSDYGWNKWTLNLSIISTIVLAIAYMSFRQCRRRVLKDCEDGKRSTKKISSIISILSFVSLSLLVWFNINLDLTEGYINAVPLVLLYALNIYGIVVILIKYALYYREESENNQWYAPIFRYGIPLIVPVIVFYSFAEPTSSSMKGDKSHNQLYYLRQVEESKEDIVSLRKYAATFSANNTDSISPFMFTSQGGGLMADLWVLLVTHELQKETKGKFLKHTFNMSANSGGAIGIANYANLALNHKGDEEAQLQAIDEVGAFNHLSLDITFLLGRDLIRMFVPNWKMGRFNENRSDYAMNQYAIRTGDGSLKVRDASFRSHWKAVYDEYDQQFPSLTISSTVVKNGGFANAFTLKMEPKDTLFEGIENTLDMRYEQSGKSLPFYDAASLSNRFPVLSPAAAINGKGQYIDGGAYDNSGLLNSLELADFLKKNTALPRPHFVVITNDQYQFIDYLFNELKHSMLNENNVGELGAMIGGGFAIDRFAEHLDKEAQNDRYTRIFLPRIISYQAVLDYLGGEPTNQDLAPDGTRLLEYIAEKVDRVNQDIKDHLSSEEAAHYEEWGAVQAPLARLLSKPAIEYEKAMLSHHLVKEQIVKVNQRLKNCKH